MEKSLGYEIKIIRIRNKGDMKRPGLKYLKKYLHKRVLGKKLSEQIAFRKQKK